MVVTIVFISPSGERTRQVAFRQGYRYNFVFTFERTEVMVEYRLLLENNDSQLLFMQFKNPVAGIWKIEIESATDAGGEVHLWLPVQEFLEGEVYFLEANPDVTLTEPGSTENAMTVAYYNSVDNAVDINSGRGYTRSNLIKPDFTAPGCVLQVHQGKTGGLQEVAPVPELQWQQVRRRCLPNGYWNSRERKA